MFTDVTMVLFIRQLLSLFSDLSLLFRFLLSAHWTSIRRRTVQQLPFRLLCAEVLRISALPNGIRRLMVRNLRIYEVRPDPSLDVRSLHSLTAPRQLNCSESLVLRWPVSFSPMAADIGLELLQQTYVSCFLNSIMLKSS